MRDSKQEYIKIGKSYSEQKNYDLAIKQFNKALEGDCPNEEAHFELGKVYYLRGMFLKAVAALEAAGRINPDNIDSSILLAKSYQALGKGECALEIFKRISNVGLVEDKTRMQLFEFFRANKMYDAAIKECEKISSGKADKIMTMDLLQLYNFQGEYERLAKKVSSLSAEPSWQEPYLRNRLLNELEISQRKTILESKPRILLVTLTNRCNLHCYMCGRGDSDWEISPKIAEEIAGLLPYLELITWQGGEVFLTKNFDRLFEKTFGFEYLKQIVITNALLIEEGWAEKIALRNNVGLTVSIDSVDEKIYEHIDIQLEHVRKLFRRGAFP